MWDTVKIGNTEQIGISTITQFDLDNDAVSVSANSRGYRINISEYDMGATIMKDTKIGAKLVKLQEAGKAKEFRAYAKLEILKHIKPVHIQNILKRTRDKAYEAGRRDTQIQLQKVLGLY